MTVPKTSVCVTGALVKPEEIIVSCERCLGRSRLSQAHDVVGSVIVKRRQARAVAKAMTEPWLGWSGLRSKRGTSETIT